MPPLQHPDAGLLRVMQRREGLRTVAILEDGSECIFLNMHYGYDIGENVALVTTNDNLALDQLETEYFSTDQVVALVDEETRQPLFSFPIEF